MPAADPYRYFRIEARELIAGLADHLLVLERAPGAAEVALLLRLAHTLKGAARVVRQPDVAGHAHALEELLAPHRDGSAPAAGAIDAGLKLVDAMRAALARLDVLPPAAAAGAAAAAAPTAQAAAVAVRVETRETEALLAGMATLAQDLAALVPEVEGIAGSRALVLALGEVVAEGAGAARGRAIVDELGERLQRLQERLEAGGERAQRDLREVRERAARMRLLPAASLFGPLERTLRDAAQELGVAARWEAVGGAIGIEAALLGLLAEALPHAGRNASAHGLEPAAARTAAGKPATGTVRLEVARHGGRVRFTLRDDGRGVDLEAVRAGAAARGRLTPAAAAALDPAALHALLLRGGITTVATPTTLAGRGVGLDTVRAALERVGGGVALASRPGQGTVLEIDVPVALSSLPALLVEAQGRAVAVPLDAVRRTLRVPVRELVVSNGCDFLLVHETTVPFLALATLLGAAPVARVAGTWTVVLIESGGSTAALGVDRLLGTAEVALRPLPPGCAPVPFLAGADLDEGGDPRLVLDAAGAVQAVRAWYGARGHRPPTPRRAPLLVIDDSITTRSLERSILESAGYEVEVAASAEQALAMAAERDYAVFVVDVEMPGMDGFTFVARTRADPRLGRVPAILVTSRDAPEDRARGKAAGAHAYLIKSEFDQNRLLELIRGLVG
jgi:two-component system chemotaxis sensor kinase CheA